MLRIMCFWAFPLWSFLEWPLERCLAWLTRAASCELLCFFIGFILGHILAGLPPGIWQLVFIASDP